MRTSFISHRAMLLACLIVLIAAGRPAFARSKKYAIVIGINRYEHEIPPLTCAVNDARLMAQALRALHFDKVRLMTSDAPRDSRDYPTRSNIIFQLSNFRTIMHRDKTSNDTFVFYYSGHGIDLKHTGSAKRDIFLVSVDGDIGNDDVLRESCCSFDKVKSEIYQMPASKVLIVWDACREDPRGGSRGVGDNKLSRAAAKDLVLKARRHAPNDASEPQTMATLYACSPDQRSYEWAARGHGYFTYFLVQGLEGKAASGPSHAVTLRSLADYCSKAVQNATEDDGKSQTPWLSTDGPPDWVVERSADAHAVAEIKDTPAPAVASGAPAPSAANSGPPDVALAPTDLNGAWKTDQGGIYEITVRDALFTAKGRNGFLIKGSISGNTIDGITSVPRCYEKSWHGYEPAYDVKATGTISADRKMIILHYEGNRYTAYWNSSLTRAMGGPPDRVETTGTQPIMLTMTRRQLPPEAPMRSDAGLRPMLGVMLDTAAPAPKNGVLVKRIMPGSVAEKMGLQSGDILVGLSGAAMADAPHFVAAMHEVPVGSAFTVDYLRNGVKSTASGRLASTLSLPTYQITEGVGLQGSVSLGQTLDQFTAVLGAPTMVEDDAKRKVKEAYFSPVGIRGEFSNEGAGPCKFLHFAYPFVGQTRSGLRTDGVAADAAAIYGQPIGKREEAARHQRIEWFDGGVGIIVDATTNRIKEVYVFQP